MRSALVIVVAVLLVTTAGCTGFGADTGWPGADPDEEPAVTDANPYGNATLTVAYDDSAVAMDMRHIVEDSLAYWEDNSEQYAGYLVEYDLNRSHPDPDKHIEFVTDLERCGEAFDAVHIGCGDRVEDHAPETAEIKIEGGYTNATLANITKHELGHTLGLDHGDDPQSIMAAEQEYTIVREVSVQLRIADAYDEDAVVHRAETAIDTWEAHLASDGHDVAHSVSVVDEFDGTAQIAYDATGSRDACGDELVCMTNATDAGEIEVTTERIRQDDHEGVLGSYYGSFQRLEADDMPQEYRFEDDD